MIEYSKSHNNLEIMNGAPEITNVIEERNVKIMLKYI